ncbi:DeoR/GlpR transcriptional regulator [Mesorhizobium sp. B2-4-15]|uniref:DeoR/GlpR family DNA-binding transcription regulator n=1 Tax=Mesorhizobium sp. B2-4-15 TaxID=2589934 RepID=UPI001151B300|nr:DeoR/GlpR family DNA-binding transcription regulator [Mesorhizobium sp. B2-4-15]TPK62429.1 DeoR/GlpR transcriptional regulator [Mesorhizobium sp. B2-4-15]
MYEDLLLKERWTLIQERLNSEGRIIAADLARELELSEDTIRRDLRGLAAQGLCVKVYGGALKVSPASGSLTERTASVPHRKAALAQAAVGLVSDGSTIFIDGGSTNQLVARFLPEAMNLRVVTNAPAIAIELGSRTNIDIILLGGRFDPHTGSCLGSRAVHELGLLRPDLTFLGACGLDAAAGVTAFSFDEADFKRGLCQVSRAIVVAATSEKLGTAAPFVITQASALAAIVVEGSARHDQIAPYTDLGIRILRAGKDQP